MENGIKDLRVSGWKEDIVNGKRIPSTVFKMEVQFREHSGTITITDPFIWPEDGVEWDVCPSEWEAIESEVQDWFNENWDKFKELKITG